MNTRWQSRLSVFGVSRGNHVLVHKSHGGLHVLITQNWTQSLHSFNLTTSSSRNLTARDMGLRALESEQHGSENWLYMSGNHSNHVILLSSRYTRENSCYNLKLFLLVMQWGAVQRAATELSGCPVSAVGRMLMVRCLQPQAAAETVLSVHFHSYQEEIHLFYSSLCNNPTIRQAVSSLCYFLLF